MGEIDPMEWIDDDPERDYPGYEDFAETLPMLRKMIRDKKKVKKPTLLASSKGIFRP